MTPEEQFPSNSHKSCRERSKQAPAISGNVKRKEDSAIKKAAKDFLADDIRDVRKYVTNEVIKPNLKGLLVDVVSKGINMFVYGEDRTPKKKSGSRFNYSRLYDEDDKDERTKRQRSRTSYRYDDLLFDNRKDAELVLEKMCDILDSCPSVSIGDMYDLAGEQTVTTDFDYGWTNLNNASVERTRDGYWYIYLPKPRSI